LASWRLVVDRAMDGAWNMAFDEAVLDAYASDGAMGAPTVRIYGWKPGALSVGRFDAVRPDRAGLRTLGIDLVRRPTGGAAVLHEHERTFAVVGRLGECGFPRSVLGTYARIAAVLARAYARLGVEVEVASGDARGGRDTGVSCFERTSAHEISWRGRKLAGSAQLRRGRAFLQHGSLPLRLEPERLSRLLGWAAAPERFTDAETAAGRQVAASELDSALVGAFTDELGADIERGELPAAWLERATLLRAWKYLDRGWTEEGTVPSPGIPSLA
jgi:lipoate-protein ligase A